MTQIMDFVRIIKLYDKTIKYNYFICTAQQ